MSSAANLLSAWRRSTLAIALAGSVLMWVALPPIAFGWLGWIATVPWLVLVQMNELPGRRPYRAIYLAGLAFWLVSIHWIRLPHPLLYFAWLALAGYLAVYLPVFVSLSRVAVHRLSLPLWFAAPVVWTGLELARAHLLTGFMMGSLAHTQVNWTEAIQISDLTGEYGVDFVMMVVAACITSGFRIGLDNPQSERSSAAQAANPKSKLSLNPLALLPGLIVLAATLAYGHFRIARLDRINEQAQHAAGPRIALIQGNSHAEWKSDSQGESRIMREYINLSERAVSEATTEKHPVDLIVWPETMYRSPLRDFEPGFKLPTTATMTTAELVASDRKELAQLARHLDVPILVGIDRIQFVADAQSISQRPTMRWFNSAVLVDIDGKIVGTYDKLHRVMFGEYIPFAHWLPFLYRISPLSGGIESGDGPVALWLKSTYCFAPNICYETAIPHVIRRQVATLQSRSEYPVALVNLTNDAWFWGSSELRMHLACDVFRAVETRVPLVAAANGGISAWIDRAGRIRAESPIQKPDFILADIDSGIVRSWYVEFGDWFAGVCLTCCAVFAFIGWKLNRKVTHAKNG